MEKELQETIINIIMMFPYQTTPMLLIMHDLKSNNNAKNNKINAAGASEEDIDKAVAYKELGDAMQNATYIVWYYYYMKHGFT